MESCTVRPLYHQYQVSSRLDGPQILSRHCEDKDNFNVRRELNPHFPQSNHYNDGGAQAVITLYTIINYDAHKFEKWPDVKTR
jgi:hypothetical protein